MDMDQVLFTDIMDEGNIAFTDCEMVLTKDAVFTHQGEEGTYSDFWCVRETIDGDEINEFVLTNDNDQ